MRLMSPENLEIELIPWDAHSESHVERLRQQRLMCGWRAESVDEWRVQQLEGRKALHWIVLKPNFAQYNKVLRKYKQRCPLEKDALMDTAPMMAPRATSHDFIPIGHISLDFEHYSGDKSLADPSQGIYTLSGFYISPVVRGRDFGQQAVVAIIALASGPPFYGRYLTCETVSRESSRQAERYAAFGVPMPQFSLLDWYESIGGKVFKENKTGWTETDPTGKVWTIGLACIGLPIHQTVQTASGISAKL